jgi:hypothetical protein
MDDQPFAAYLLKNISTSTLELIRRETLRLSQPGAPVPNRQSRVMAVSGQDPWAAFLSWLAPPAIN